MHPGEKKVNPPIGTLYYLFWGDTFARECGSKHEAVICDSPLRHDGVSEDDMKSRIRQKTEILGRAISAFGLKETSPVLWSDYVSLDHDYSRAVLEMANISRRDSEFGKILEESIPKAYKSNTMSQLYMLEQVSGIITFTNIGFPVRIGHIMERRIDDLLNYLVNNHGFGKKLSSAVQVFYLKGDYNINTTDPNAGLPPSKEVDPRRRIMLLDSADTVMAKVGNASKIYQKWLWSILKLSGQETGTQQGSLAELVIEKLLLPIQQW